MGLKAKARAAAHGVSRPCLWRTVVIHASAWEATPLAAGRGGDGQSFQSTPPRGRRPGIAPCAGANGGFQSTPPRGRRLSASRARSLRLSCFNPRLRVGGDPPARRKPRGPAGFNPRLRVGGDPVRRRKPRRTCRFNPRLRVGGDPSVALDSVVTRLSKL